MKKTLINRCIKGKDNINGYATYELKTHKITHTDIGQLQMYVNYYDRNERLADENPTIGILLCADKNNEVVKYSLPKENKTIMASKYQLYLPTEKQLLMELKREIDEIEDLKQDGESE